MLHVGRGRAYGPLRHAAEWLMYRAYGSGWAARLVYALGHQRRIDVRRYDLVLDSFPRAAPELTVAFASDFHAGPVTHPALLRKACDRLAEVRPDVVLYGGDYVFLEARHVEPLAPLLGAVPAALGRYAILGNHDLWTHEQEIIDRLESNNIQLLMNRNVALPAPYEDISIIGLDDGLSGDPDPERAFADAGPARIVMTHSPATLDCLRGYRFDLAFGGHTHGGQIALPGGHPILVPLGSRGRKLGRGALHTGIHDTAGVLIVSRGVGYVDIPIRLFACPDIVVCTLRGPATPSEDES